jgi:hypothetical protein
MRSKKMKPSEHHARGLELLAQAEGYDPLSDEAANLATLATAHFEASQSIIAWRVGESQRLRLDAPW